MRLYDLQRMAEAGGALPNGGSSNSSKDGNDRAGDGGCVTLHGHAGPVFGVDLSAEGQFLFSGSADG